MRELKSSEFIQVIPLLNQEKVHCTFAYSVAEGKQPGRVFVDNSVEPRCCLIACRSGKYLVGGETDRTSFNEFVSDFLRNRSNHSCYFDLYSASQDWISQVDEMLGDNAAKLSRQLFEWDNSSLSTDTLRNQTLPEGFELKRMDSALFEKYAREMDPSYNDLWETPHNFVSKGFGFCILKDDEFVSVCNTYFVSQSYAEIDVVTKDKFRGQGFALITCSEFIKHCVQNDTKPLWDCDNGNEGSKKLALKLGFKSIETYQMHWWHENKKFVDMYLEKFNYISQSGQ